jgi:hypothetical protein
MTPDAPVMATMSRRGAGAVLDAAVGGAAAGDMGFGSGGSGGVAILAAAAAP